MLAFNTSKEWLDKITLLVKRNYKVVDANNKVLILILLMVEAYMAYGQSDTITYQLPGDGTLVKNGVVVDAYQELDTLPYDTAWKFVKTGGSATIYSSSVDCDIKSNDACTADTNDPIVSKKNSQASDNLADFRLEDGNYNEIVDMNVVLADQSVPLNLLSFTAQINNNTLKVKWETVNLMNVEKTEVEISSNGLKDFMPIATKTYRENRIEKSIHQIRVAVRDIINKLKSYGKYDPANDEYLIRLKTTNENGTTELSKMLNINIGLQKGNIAALIVPNPVIQGKSVQLDIFIENQN